ncbi:MAG: phytochelatin synthase family protein [Elusimicrobiota bacterium]|jgi:hypothetical protein
MKTISRACLVAITGTSLLLAGALSAAAEPKYGPAGDPVAAPLSREHAYLSSSSGVSSDYWRLSPFYVPQYNEYSCSAAAAVAAFNALLSQGRERGDSDRNLTQAALLADPVNADWRDLLSPAGLKGRHGVTLEQLEAFLKRNLKPRGCRGCTVERREVSETGEETREAFRKALAAGENDPHDVLLVHFVQDELTKAPGGPFAHVSPVGGYDAATRRVLILDVDRDWYEPYWVPERRLVEAMARRTREFGCGGWIRLRAP